MLTRIVSGGQTGVDRAGLEAARAASIDCGGWCPRGRRAEDGVIPSRYPLRETRSAGYEDRTRRNVEDSDGTLIITRGTPTGGTAYTIAAAARCRRPCLIIDLEEEERRHDRFSDDAAVRIADWLAREKIRVLNIAGPRESKVPGIFADSLYLLRNLFEY